MESLIGDHPNELPEQVLDNTFPTCDRTLRLNRPAFEIHERFLQELATYNHCLGLAQSEIISGRKQSLCEDPQSHPKLLLECIESISLHNGVRLENAILEAF